MDYKVKSDTSIGDFIYKNNHYINYACLFASTQILDISLDEFFKNPSPDTYELNLSYFLLIWIAVVLKMVFEWANNLKNRT